MTLNHVCLSVIICCTLMGLIEPISGAGFCDGKPDGNYRDPDNSYGYIACSNQNVHKRDCPPGFLEYNEGHKDNDWPQNVPCKRDPATFTCQGKPDGNYKDPNGCYGYIACSNGNMYHMDCPAGLKYNEQKERCDYPENVMC